MADRQDNRAAAEPICEVGRLALVCPEKGDSIPPVECEACVVEHSTQGSLSRLRAGKRQEGLAERALRVHGPPWLGVQSGNASDPPEGRS